MVSDTLETGRESPTEKKVAYSVYYHLALELAEMEGSEVPESRFKDSAKSEMSRPAPRRVRVMSRSTQLRGDRLGRLGIMMMILSLIAI